VRSIKGECLSKVISSVTFRRAANQSVFAPLSSRTQNHQGKEHLLLFPAPNSPPPSPPVNITCHQR
jgi:hypothetical protein